MENTTSAQTAATTPNVPVEDPAVKIRQLEEVITGLQAYQEERETADLWWKIGIGAGALAVGAGIGYLIWGRE